MTCENVGSNTYLDIKIGYFNNTELVQAQLRQVYIIRIYVKYLNNPIELIQQKSH